MVCEARPGGRFGDTFGLRSRGNKSLVALLLYRAIRLRFGYGFESCDANGPRNVKIRNPAKYRPVFSPTPLLPFGSQESVLKVPKQGQFLAAIRVTLLGKSHFSYMQECFRN